MKRREVSLWAAFVVPAALLGVLACLDGGYDIEVRQQVFLIVWWVLALGVAFGALPRALPAPTWRLTTLGGTMMVAAGVAALAWTSSDERAVNEVARVLGYAGIVAAAWLCLGPRTWRAAAAGLFAVAAGICGLALASRLTTSVFPLDSIERALGTERLFKPLGYWNGLGTWAAMTVAMALAWSADGSQRWIRSAALASAPAALAVIYLTYSRGALLELAIGISIVIAMARHRVRAALHGAGLVAAGLLVVAAIRLDPEIANGIGHSGAGIVVVAVAVSSAACWALARATRMGDLRSRDPDPHRPPPRLGRVAAAMTVFALAALLAFTLIGGRKGLGAGGDSAAISASDPARRLVTASGNRSAYWSEALSAFRDEPIHGSGPGTFQYRWARYGSEHELVAHAHSLLFETLAEQGIVGLLALALTLAGLAVGAARGVRVAAGHAEVPAMAAVFAMFLVAAAIDWTWQLTAVSVLGLAAAAVLAAAASKPPHRHRRRGRLGHPVRGHTAFALAVVALLAGATQIPGVVMTDRIRSADRSIASDQVRRALEAAGEAVTAAPWAASAYAARSRAELADGQLKAAREDAGEAIDREPQEPAHHLLLASIDVDGRRFGPAMDQLRRTRALSPISLHRFAAEAVALLSRIREARARYREKAPKLGM